MSYKFMSLKLFIYLLKIAKRQMERDNVLSNYIYIYNQEKKKKGHAFEMPCNNVRGRVKK